jgi:hypothetical protein
VKNGKICMSMIGLLYALPNTQLTRRLSKENRLFENSSTLDDGGNPSVDQATSGLNFITARPRNEIINDFIYVLKKVYRRKSYFDRCLKVGRVLRTQRKHKTSFGKKIMVTRSLLRLIYRLGLRPATFYYFWRNLVAIVFTRPSSAEEVANLMAMYIHFRKQTKYIVKLMSRNVEENALSVDS